jgi:hypothetical protein
MEGSIETKIVHFFLQITKNHMKNKTPMERFVVSTNLI